MLEGSSGVRVEEKEKKAEGQRIHIEGIQSGLHFSTGHIGYLYDGDSSIDLTQVLINELMFLKPTMIFR